MTSTSFPFTTWRKADLRILCLPDAGGSAIAFKLWNDLLPSIVDVAPVEIPGHGTRSGEQPLESVQEVVASIAQDLRKGADTPLAIFGHSMGALLAFELARRIEDTGKKIEALFVSGYPAPHLPWNRPPIGHLEPRKFAQALVDIFEADEILVRDENLLASIYPVLRADFRLVENYVFQSREALSCPISVFGGDKDPEASIEELEAWRQHTSNQFQLRILKGRHTFIHESRTDLLRFIQDDLMLGQSFQ